MKLIGVEGCGDNSYYEIVKNENLFHELLDAKLGEEVFVYPVNNDVKFEIGKDGYFTISSITFSFDYIAFALKRKDYGTHIFLKYTIKK